MNIRQANLTDGLLLSTLCLDVQRLHAEHHPEIFKFPSSDDFANDFFDEVLADPSISIFIAEIEQEALGYILCKLVERQENPFTYAMRFVMIDQIGVRPAARGRGVGAALIQRAEEFAKELGVKRIQLDSWEFNSKAHRFFERLGFRKFFFRFWRDL